MAPGGDTMAVLCLDLKAEARARAVARPFYERRTQTPP
jgi:hypothetical protein